MRIRKVKWLSIAALLISAGLATILYFRLNSKSTCHSAHECALQEQRRRLLRNENWLLDEEDSMHEPTVLESHRRQHEIPDLGPNGVLDKILQQSINGEIKRDANRIVNKVNWSLEDQINSVKHKDIPKTTRKTTISRPERDYSVLANSNCSNTLDNPHLVLNCITGSVMGKIPNDVQLGPFRLPPNLQSESADSREASFRSVFVNKAWGTAWDPHYKDLSTSGRGSTLDWAQELIATLHVTINTLKTKLGKTSIRMLDVPCGDMAWMSRFLISRDDVEYTGIDIVPDLIAHHNKTYRNFPWRFKVQDIVESPVDQAYDLILSRMMIQHLFFYDAAKVLKRFSESSSHYLLTTTFSSHDQNMELVFGSDNPGRFRMVNLEVPPFSLSPPLCLQRDGPRTDRIDPWSHFFGVWKLPLRQLIDCDYPYKIKLKGTDKHTYSCTDWLIS